MTTIAYTHIAAKRCYVVYATVGGHFKERFQQNTIRFLIKFNHKKNFCMKNKENWMQNPSKTVTLIFGFGWLIGVILVILATTDLFTESPFKTKNTLIFLLLLGSTGATFKVIRNYYNNRKQRT